MAQQQPHPEEVVLGQEIGGARVIPLNRPRQLNGISDRVVYLLAQFLERWEKDDSAKLVIFKVLTFHAITSTSEKADYRTICSAALGQCEI
uniref:Enoyl-CoA hydratase/isomerase domain-containing protein n=1 Tax=Arundo donax TaxID=35708 RepID=A0A0A9CZB5_ARUDO